MTIGVFFGGKSPEHDISIITGQLILSGLKNLGLNAVPIYLDKEGSFHLGDELGSISFFQNPHIHLAPSQKWHLDLEASKGKMVFKKKGFVLSLSKGWRKKIITIDLAFPAFHGQNGEDGTAQGLFEMFNIPYIGCGVSASAITMDKVLTKLFYENAGFPTTKFIYFYKKDWEKNKENFIIKIKTGLAWPVFVKPARLGSSIGIAKTTNEKELIFAIDVAFHYDDKILVEEGVQNLMDITCAVIGNNNPQPSLLQESVFNNSFFSYEDKYLNNGGAQLGKAKKSIVIPARLDETTTVMIQNIAVQVFTKFECAGIARVDFLYDTVHKKIFVNEINPLPGTLYHHLWEKSGISFPTLLTRLIAFAEDRHREKNAITTTFESTILRQADWSKKLGK